jgi:hypothetical protein
MEKVMKVNFDSLAMRQTFVVGDQTFRKVSSMVSENVETGELLYDARLFPIFPDAEPPMVECPQFDKENS